MFDILLDTADDRYIETKWEQLKDFIPSKNIVGITTNPNAFYKVNDLSLEQWRDRSIRLSSLLSYVRNDNDGVLHLQFPNSILTVEKFKKWIDVVNNFNLSCKVAIKIPPYRKALEIALEHSQGYEINVTGISDAGTALFALNHNINYASIIPGRMEEVGIDAKSHVSYVSSINLGKKKIITGSMRTLEGLKWCVEFGTLPTIGTRILDLIQPEMIETLETWKYVRPQQINFCPLNTNTNKQLSIDFFKQMDEMGKEAYEYL